VTTSSTGRLSALLQGDPRTSAVGVVTQFDRLCDDVDHGAVA
jgi:hypothetical protein